MRVSAINVMGALGIYQSEGGTLAPVPAGEYAFFYVRLVGQAKEGDWQYGLYAPKGIRVGGGQTAQVSIGGPLSWRIQGEDAMKDADAKAPLVFRAGDEARFSPQLVDAGGLMVQYFVAPKERVRVTAVLRDAKGKAVASGEVRTRGERPAACLKLPEKLAPGIYTLDVSQDTGPLQGIVKGSRPVRVE